MTPLVATALSAIAPRMRELVHSPQATCYYEVMSDALVWSDEFPKGRGFLKIPGWSIIRVVLGFRTELILGQPNEQFWEYWDEALRLFPEWPAFDPKRRSPELREVFREMSASSNAELDEIERDLDMRAHDEL